MHVDPSLIDRLYEAALTPEAMPLVMQDIADLVGSKGMIVMSVGDQDLFLPSPGVQRLVEDYVTGGFTGNEARTTRMYHEQPPGFVSESAYRTADELYALPIYRDFLLPRGCFGAAGTPIQGTGDVGIHIAAEGFPSLAAAENAVPMLDALRPHLARAFSLSTKLEAVRADAIVAGLAAGGVAAAVVGRDRRLVSANPGFQRRFGDGMFESRTGLRFAHAVLDARFRAALAGIGAGDAAQSIAVPPAPDNPPCVVHLLPIVRAGREVLGSDGIIMVVAEAANASVPNADLLRLLFDLTPAEARLTRLLVEGQPLAKAATTLGITEGTARVQLRGVFAKTGVKRQAELVALLSGLGTPAPKS